MIHLTRATVLAWQFDYESGYSWFNVPAFEAKLIGECVYILIAPNYTFTRDGLEIQKSYLEGDHIALYVFFQTHRGDQAKIFSGTYDTYCEAVEALEGEVIPYLRDYAHALLGETL